LSSLSKDADSKSAWGGRRTLEGAFSSWCEAGHGAQAYVSPLTVRARTAPRRNGFSIFCKRRWKMASRARVAIAQRARAQGSPRYSPASARKGTSWNTAGLATLSRYGRICFGPKKTRPRESAGIWPTRDNHEHARHNRPGRWRSDLKERATADHNESHSDADLRGGYDCRPRFADISCG